MVNHKNNAKYFLSPANEMQFSDRQLNLSDRQ